MDSGKIYHVAAYERLSREDDDVSAFGKTESNSITNQRSLIQNFINDREDMTLTKEYVDDGYSGATFERPKFQEMLSDIKDGIVNCVIVKDLSRFGREYIDAGLYIERLFPSLGVRFIAINDNIDTMDGRENDIILPFKNLLNDAYCRDISIKIRSHLEVLRKKGEYVGPFVAYGYVKSEDDVHKIVPDEFAAGVVKDIYKWKLSGMSPDKIADRLNEQGVASPLEHKHSQGVNLNENFKRNGRAMWSQMAVRRILSNEIYTGVLIQGKRSTPNNKVKTSFIKPEDEWVRIEDNHEAVIDRHTFDLVQRVMAIDERCGVGKSAVYPLSGLLYCADCGAPMKKKNVPAYGKVYSYYVCSGNDLHRNCKPHRIPVEALESMVLKLLQVHIENVADIEEIVKYVDDAPFQEIEIKALVKRRKAQEKEASKCRDMRFHLYEDMKEGLLGRDDYMEMYAGYEDRQRRAEKIIETLSRQIDEIKEEKTDKYDWISYFTEYRNLPELTRLAAVELIDNICIHDKKHIDVTFRFDDCYESVLTMLSSSGYEVTEDAGRLAVGRREVV